MSTTEGLTRADLARRLGVSVSVLRKWEDTFSPWLVTQKGVKGFGAAKVYDPQDVRVLSLVHKMRQEGLTLEQVRDGLSDRLATAADEVAPDLPTVPDRPKEVSLQSYVDLLGRYEATEGQLQAVTEERDYLRQRVEDLQDRLLDTQARAAAAEGKIDLLRDMGLTRAEGAGQPVLPDEDEAPAGPGHTETETRPSFWDRLLGRGRQE